MIISKNRCTGCMACLQVCPNDAIEIIEDELGFKFPQINKDRCTNCNLCKNTCPIENFNSKNTVNLICMASMADDEIRKNSSSGGLFSVLASEFLKLEDSIVIGCTNTNSLKVEHISISEESDLYKLRGSKYVQSDTSNIYKETKDFLKQGKKVLFSGTPCQIAGLYSFLKGKPDALTTVEIMCHGVSSQQIFDKYIKEEFPNVQVNNVCFRDKTKGWNYNLLLKVTANGTETFIPCKESSYFKLFLDDISLRESCYHCAFAKMPRVADISLGDFWEVEQFNKKLNDGLGTSMVLLNSQKGIALYDKIKNFLKLSVNASFEIAKIGNPTLYHPSIKNPLKDEFLKNYNKMTLKENINHLKNFKFDCAILNFWWGNNYGAVLTAYALQQLLKGLNYNSLLVKYIFGQSIDKDYYNGLSNTFEKEHLLTSKLYYSENDLKELNHLADRFIVGSDQVFRYEYKVDDTFMLNFVDYDKTKIAFSASFGKNKFGCPKYQLPKYKFLLSRFDDISTREISGVNICKNEFNLEATQIIDPIFALDMQFWDKIISESKLKNKKYVLSYMLDKSQSVSEKIQNFAKEKSLPIVEIDQKQHSIQDWLYLIKNAEYIITDSFHGLCFSLIFNKRVKCFANSNRGFERFVTLQELLNLPKSIFTNEKFENLIFEEINYAEINKKIENNKQKCIKHLSFVMNIKKENNNDEEKLKDELQLKKYRNLKNDSNSFVENVFSVKNTFDKRHKVITFFGLKFKFRKINKTLQ